MTTKIKVLIVENIFDVQEYLRKLLEPHGIEVAIAGNVGEARHMAESLWEELDVALLDVRLDDPDEKETTGTEIAIEILKKKKDLFAPEFIIFTEHDASDYYRSALDLGAAAYLIKPEDPTMHVKVLALRRALNGRNPKIKSEVERIAVQSREISDAILTFCRRILQTAFDSYLNVPFVILFTEENATLNCADNIGMPAGSNALYHKLQALAHGKGNPTKPFVLDTAKLEPPTDRETAQLYKKLDRAAFLPLSLSNNMKLSIGILPHGERMMASEPTAQEVICSVLAQHLRPTVLENIISLWSQQTEFRVTRESTAKLCLRVGQEINDGLAMDDLEQLGDLANDLDITGQYLTQLDSRKWREEGEDVSIREVLDATWEMIAQSETQPAKKPNLQGDCILRAQRSDVVIIFSRLLQWFAYRSEATPLGVEPEIKIECDTTDGYAILTFEDKSHRLPPELRRDLFAPFTQAISTPFSKITDSNLKTKEAVAEAPTTGRYLPLYLAKMLVEGRYLGRLEDRSDAIEGRAYGHRITMQMPTSNKTA
jgi:CheY-like chemotaxis protein